MTIGIGVLASEQKKPDRVVLIADTLGSFGDTHSTSELHKLFPYPVDDICVAGADDISRAAEFVPIILQRLRTIQGPRSYADIQNALLFAANVYKRERFNMACLPRFYITPEQWMQGQLNTATVNEINRTYEDFYVGCQLLIGAFDHNGQALLFGLPGDGTVTNQCFPGFAAIGSGADNATFWLGYRRHTLACSLKRSAYHAYEAKRMAETSPHVNERIDMILAEKGKQVNLNHRQLSVENCPVSINELSELFKEFNVKDTGSLDPEDQGKKLTFT